MPVRHATGLSRGKARSPVRDQLSGHLGTAASQHSLCSGLTSAERVSSDPRAP